MGTIKITCKVARRRNVSLPIKFYSSLEWSKRTQLMEIRKNQKDAKMELGKNK